MGRKSLERNNEEKKFSIQPYRRIIDVTPSIKTPSTPLTYIRKQCITNYLL